MRTTRSILVSALLLIANLYEPVKCDEGGWENTSNPGEVDHDSSTAPSTNAEPDHQAATDDFNAGVSPQQDSSWTRQQESNGTENSITEPSNAGWSGKPPQSDSQEVSSEQEPTASDNPKAESSLAESEHVNTEPKLANDGDKPVESGSSSVEHSTYYHDSQGDLGFTDSSMDTTPGGDNNTDGSQWSTEPSKSQAVENQQEAEYGQSEASVTDTPSSYDNRWNTTDDPRGQPAIDSGDGVMQYNGSTEYPGSGTSFPDEQTRNELITTPGTPQDASEMPQEATPDSDSWRNDDQEASSSNDGASVPPSDFDDPQYEGQSPPPDYDQVTLGTDYGAIPEDEPDNTGDELVVACKKESNYQGDFQDPSESSAELKCFYACAMVKMDVMNELNGQMQLNMETTVNMIEDAFGDNSEMIEKYKNAASTCDQEVQKGGDRCEYAFSFINCGIQKVS